jgi:hypothetical protein
MTRFHGLAAFAAAAFVAGCAAPPAPPPPVQTVSVARLYAQPAEHAFLNALRLVEDGQYEKAEPLFRQALAEGLRDRHDVAMANKHLAFIACAFNRPVECESAFRAAFAADPGFTLTEAEVGHPLWGPVYRRVAAEQRPQAAGKP